MDATILPDQLVRKHNSLIEARFNEFSTLERKLINITIAQIKKEDRDGGELKMYRFPITELKKALGIGYNSIHEELKTITKKLFDRSILIEDDTGDWEIKRYLDKAYYKEGYLYLKLHEDIRDLVLVKKNYTESELINTISLNGNAISIYEWSKKWVKLKKKLIDLEEFKLMLGVSGKYKNFADFRKRILIPSILEIEQKTDISLSYSEICERKKVVALEFRFENQKRKGFVIDYDEIDRKETTGNIDGNKTKKDLRKYFSLEKIDSLFDEFKDDEERIRAGLLFYLADVKRGVTIHRPDGYIYTAILNERGKDLIEKEKRKEKENAKASGAKKEESEKKDRDENDRLKARFIFQSLSAEEQQQIEDEFLTDAATLNTHKSAFAKTGRDSFFFEMFVKNRLKDII
ncbi:MAG: replication initiation protein [Kaistella sp.]